MLIRLRHALTAVVQTTWQSLMLPLAVLIAGILWSSLVLGMALWLALTLKVPQNNRQVMTPQATGTRKELSEGLTGNDRIRLD